MIKLACQNCDWTGNEKTVEPLVGRLYERVAPGELMPYGECPECGAAVHEALGGGPEVVVVLDNGEPMDILFFDCPKGMKVIVRDFQDPEDVTLDEQINE